METLRAVFTAPKDCRGDLLNIIFKENARKFLDHFEAEGWVLRSPLDFYQDFGASKEDPNQLHYIIVGVFSDDFKKKERGELHLPEKVVQKLLKKMPEKVRIYGRD
jgi:hypothetical protein